MFYSKRKNYSKTKLSSIPFHNFFQAKSIGFKMKSCDCKGKRTCLLCEKLTDKKPKDFFLEFQVGHFSHNINFKHNYFSTFIPNINNYLKFCFFLLINAYYNFRVWIRTSFVATVKKSTKDGKCLEAVKITMA